MHASLEFPITHTHHGRWRRMIVSHNIASFEIKKHGFLHPSRTPSTTGRFLGWICIFVQGSSLDVRQTFLRTTSGLEPRKSRFLARGSVWLTKDCQRCHAIAKFLSNARIPSAIFDLIGGFSCEKSQVLRFKGLDFLDSKWLRETCHELRVYGHMIRVEWPTFTININQNLEKIYQSHGSYDHIHMG